MSADYDLHLVTPLKPRQVLQLLADEFSLKRSGEHHLYGEAVWLTVGEQTQRRASGLEEDFGFKPDLLVVFELDPNSSLYENGKHLMVRAVMSLLKNAAGDAVLLFNGEHILLQRTNGELVINEGWSEWESYDLYADITPPYAVRNLPSPLL